MLKTRIISISILLLLIVGVTVNVRAGVDSDASKQKSTEKEQSDSDKESQQKPQQTISQLDFFGAFSLVNIQLHWRDFHAGLNDDVTDTEASVIQNELPLEAFTTLSNENNEQIVPTSSIISTGNAVAPITTYRTIDGTTDFICNQNTQRASTIAYILNCGNTH